MPRSQEIFTGRDPPLCQPTDSKYKNKVNDETDVVDCSKCQDLLFPGELYRTASTVFFSLHLMRGRINGLVSVRQMADCNGFAQE